MKAFEKNTGYEAAALGFVEKGRLRGVEPLGDGNINDTYLVHGPGASFVLQRINGHVFSRPEQVVANFQVVTTHLAAKARRDCPWWRPVHLLPTTTGQPFFKDSHGNTWRAQSYLAETGTYFALDTCEQARQVGKTLGCFHRLLADLPVSSLHETLPGFHVLSMYLAHFDRIRDEARIQDSPQLKCCFEMVAEHRGRLDLLLRAQEKGLLIPHIIHGDPKADNVLFDVRTQEAVCLIDLDTVRPGLLLYDIGDCLRSCCNRGGEKGSDTVVFDIDLAHEILTGYSTGAQDLFTDQDREYLHDAVCLLTFELGLRFLTDYLDGNRYFKICDPGENLLRACRQFQLLDSLLGTGHINL